MLRIINSQIKLAPKQIPILLLFISIIIGSFNIARAQDQNNAKNALSAEANLNNDTETKAITNTITKESSDDSSEGYKIPSPIALKHYYLGNYYFNKFDLPLAEVELDQSITHTPDFKAAHRDLCFLSLLRLNFARSVAEFMLVTGITIPIEYTEDEKAQLNKKAYDLHYKKALAYARKNNWRESKTELEWAKIYDPKNFSVQRSLAFAYANLGDYDKAEKQYENSFQLISADGATHADYAYMLSEHGNLVKAQNELAEAVKIEPNVPALHVDLGWMAEHRGDLKTAKAEFQKAVEISPKYSGLWLHLGRILEQEGQIAEAKSAYSKALAINPDQLQAKEGIERLSKQNPS